MDDYEPAIKINDLILELQNLEKSHGNLPVILIDPDTEWNLNVGAQYIRGNIVPEHVAIVAGYGSR